MPVRQKTFRIEQMTAAGTPRSVSANGASAALQHHEVLTELKALRDLIERRAPAAPQPIGCDGDSDPRQAVKPDHMTIGDLNKLKSETDSIHRAISRTMEELASLQFGAFSEAGEGRASRELDAVVNSTERATQQILEAVEAIDEAANTLSASLRHEQEQALASDIRDHVVRIFEACNFQDLSGQRIGKVLATLKFVEDRVARMLEIWGGRDALKDYTAAVVVAPGNGENKLLAGPKLDGDPGHLSQHEIDSMFG
ncbi:MAG TPA: chemotaxis protein [Xanthobacteraceae bacterium]